MRSATTTAALEEIQNKLISHNNKTEIRLKVWVSRAWFICDDIDWEKGFNWTEGGKIDKYATVALTPLASTIDFQVYNKEGRYSPGSGTTYEDVFDLNTKIKLEAGYRLDELLDEIDKSIDLGNDEGAVVYSYFYKTEFSSDTVILDSDGTASAAHFSDVFSPLYDSETYGDSFYSPDACTVQTYDSSNKDYEVFNGIKVTANNTNGKIYYRVLNDPDDFGSSVLADWTYAGVTVNGEQEITFSAIADYRYIQVGIIWDGVAWAGGATISDITVSLQSYIDWVYSNVYYLDNPSFDDPPAPEIPFIYCNGRDAWKKAIETDINIEDYSASNISPTDYIKTVADKCGILYNDTSIFEITGFTDINWGIGFEDTKRGNEAFELIMQKINPAGYEMYMKYDSTLDDNILYVQLTPDTLIADGVFSYKNYKNIANNKKNSDKILKRYTVINASQFVNSESQLDQQSINSTGDTVFSWSGETIYRRFEADLPDNITATVTVTNESATLNVTAITGTVVVTLYGCNFQGSIKSVIFTGTGLDDLSTAGKYTAGTVKTFKVEIDSTPGVGVVPDTFEWYIDGVSQASGVDIADRNNLTDGVAIKFSDIQGHTIGDYWTFRTSISPIEYYGEAINFYNQIHNIGSTLKVTNVLVTSDAECKTAAESFIDDFADPIQESQGLTWPYVNLLPEINDVFMLWRRFIFNDNLYYITRGKHHWDRGKRPNENTSFNLYDSGRNFSETSDFVWDDSPTPMDWDRGFVWDMGISTPLSTASEIDDATVIVHNTDC